MYVEAGYNGIVVTDHYSPMTFPIHRLACPPKGGGFLPVRLSADASGAPEGFYCAAGYGAAPLLDRQRLPDLRRDGGVYQECRQFDECVEPGIKALCEQNGFLIYQAHPFRVGIRRTDPKKNIDGVEVYNGKTDDRRNAQALAWAKENGKLMVSGFRLSHPGAFGKGRNYHQKPIQNNADLLTILKNSDFRLINVDL